MSHLRVTSLASGSSGNACLIEAGSACFLIDAGIPMNQITRELRGMGIDPKRLAAVLLTHEHIDHVRSAGAISRRYRVPIVATPGTLEAGCTDLGKLGEPARPMPVGATLALGSVQVTSFLLSHDAQEPVGFFIEYEDWRICLATDLGEVRKSMYEYLEAADLVILEANHDRPTLIQNPEYSDRLKWRILSDKGHLSNEQAGGVAGEVLGNRPQCLWLAHLSEENNTPEKAVKQVSKHLHMADKHHQVRVEVALRDRRSVSWCAGEALMQGTLF